MVRALDREPAPRRLQSGVVVGIALLISAPFLIWIPDSSDPAASLGLALQTLVGLVASTRLWANGTLDGLVSWIARQIGRGRSRILGPLDGRVLSMFIATFSFIAVRHLAETIWAITPPGPLGFAVAIPVLMIFACTALLLLLSMLMFVAVVISPLEPLPEGEAMTGLQARLTETRWFWPLLIPVFVIGGLLQH
jgi:hypothetical protein